MNELASAYYTKVYEWFFVVRERDAYNCGVQRVRLFPMVEWHTCTYL